MAGIQKILENVKNPIFANLKHKITYGYMDKDYGSAHYGADLVPGAVGVVSDVIAIEDGEVIYIKNTVKTSLDLNKKSNWNSPDVLGNNIKIRHSNGYISRYCHLAYGSLKVAKGDKVKKGQIIATIGNTGLSSAAHVHFEIWTGNTSSTRVDPEPYLLGNKTLKKQPIKPVKYKVNCAALNVRVAPSLNSKVVNPIAPLLRNTVITAYEGTETVADNYVWIKIGYSCSSAWVAKKYLTKA
ncbi:MAG: peptidoglycan DD-metalloendopeptidase family protein [Ruminiclostridium sp.]